MNRAVVFGFILAASVQAAELPVWFDTFEYTRESRTGWQNFRDAYALDFIEADAPTAGKAMRVHVKFSAANRVAILIWRFPDVQMKKFRIQVQAPKGIGSANVYLQMTSNDTKGDAAFFKPWNNGKSLFDLPVYTVEGWKTQPASALPAGKWVTYEGTMPDDVFYEQKKQKSNNQVLDFALMNTGRDQLKLSADSRPATEAFFISFQVPKDSPLFGRDLEFLVDLAEIY